MSIEDCGTDDPNLIDPVRLRKDTVWNDVVDAQARAGQQIILYKGFEAMTDPRNEEAIKGIFDLATKKALQKAGVLDENFDVIPGQEEYVCFLPKKKEQKIEDNLPL